MMSGPSPPLPFVSRVGKPSMPWHHWRRMFQNYLIASGSDGFSPARQKTPLLHALGAETGIIFCTFPEPLSSTSASTEENEFDQVMCKLHAHFAITLSVMAERSCLRKRGQELDEDIDDYITTLRGLTSTCDFGGRVDEITRDQLVEKTSTPQLREHFLLKGSSLALDKAVLLARRYEARGIPCTSNDVH